MPWEDLSKQERSALRPWSKVRSMTFLGDLILRLLKLGLVDHKSRLTPAGVELYETRPQRHGLITGAPAFARLQPVHVVSGNPGTPGNFFHGQLARRPTQRLVSW